MKVLVVYYSVNGNTLKMAKAAAEGASAAKGADVTLLRVPETLPLEPGERNERVKNAQILQKGIPVARVQDLTECDALLLGSPASCGTMCAQVKSFLDQADRLRLDGTLENKPGGAFTCGAEPYGGTESALMSLIAPLLHMGMFIVGVPYSAAGRAVRHVSPFGASAVVPAGQFPAEADLGVVRFLGQRVAEAAGKRYRTA